MLYVKYIQQHTILFAFNNWILSDFKSTQSDIFIHIESTSHSF